MNNSIYDKLIKPIRDRYISSCIENLTIETYSPYDKDLNFEERLAPILKFKEKVLDWTKNTIYGLDSFPYVYVVNGNTDYLNNIFMAAEGTLAWKKGDYSYYSILARFLNKNYQELEHPQEVDNFICSWPGYSNGDSTEYEFARQCKAKRLHLDVAYLGLTEPVAVNAGDFSTVGISFSKSLSIPYNRIALVFSKKEIITLSLMNKIGYVNLSGVKIASALLDKIPPDYWWNKYKDEYILATTTNQMTTTKCILFAYINNVRQSTAHFFTQKN